MSKNRNKISKKRLLNILTFFDEKRIGRFVARNIFKNNHYTRFYWFYLGLIIVSFTLFVLNHIHPMGELRKWATAIMGSFIAVLLPIHIIHEFLRAKMLKSVGNIKAKYIWSWKNMMLKVKYHQIEQTTKEDLIKVNLLPFILFSITPYSFSFFTDTYFRIFLLSLAFFHGIYCIKAFALLSFLKRKKKRKATNLAINT